MNNNMKYAIISKKGSYDYDIDFIETEHSKSYSMYRSNAEHWTEPGEHILTITDDGNNMHLNPKLKKELDYGQFAELTVLLEFIHKKDEVLMEEYTIYKPI
jgi:hypothetical protein